MAYPRIGINPVAGFWENGIGRETIPASGVTPSRLQHWDMHLGNVFVGDVNRIDREHELSPLLKASISSPPVPCDSNLYLTRVTLFLTCNNVAVRLW